MKLPDFEKSAELNQLRRLIGAESFGNFRLIADPNRLTEKELEELVNGGLDVKSLDDVRVLPDGTLAYKDSRILLYIRDIANYRGTGAGAAQVLPKFHFANCETLVMMRDAKRFGRYVVAARQDGRFEVHIIENNRVARSSAERLNVCQNCLDHIGYDGFNRNLSGETRSKKVKSFRLEEFFQKFPRVLPLEQPLHRSDTAPINLYPEAFDKLSTEIKEERGYRCEGEGCGIDLSSVELRKYLHLHHINGQKWDSKPENLTLRCIACHANEPGHAHMTGLPEYSKFIAKKNELLGHSSSQRLDAVHAMPRRFEFSDESFFRFARNHKFRVEDHRANRGALWAHGPKGEEHVIAELQRWGFKYKDGRGWWRK